MSVSDEDRGRLLLLGMETFHYDIENKWYMFYFPSSRMVRDAASGYGIVGRTEEELVKKVLGGL